MLTRHPMLSLIKEEVNLSDFFDPKVGTEPDRMTSYAMELLKTDRRKK